MTITADTTRTDTPMDPEGRSYQSQVITLQAQDQAGAVVALVTDAAGAVEAVPECPAFPHLPADIQHALADFDARVADGRLPIAADGYPAIPAAAGTWISDFLHSHIPDGDLSACRCAPRCAMGRIADCGAETFQVGNSRLQNASRSGLAAGSLGHTGSQNDAGPRNASRTPQETQRPANRRS